MASMNIQLHELKRILGTITEPARRHKCSDCGQVFVCQLCCKSAPEFFGAHPLHTAETATYHCEECLIRLDVHSIYASDNNGRKRIYDAFTGEILFEYFGRIEGQDGTCVHWQKIRKARSIATISSGIDTKG